MTTGISTTYEKDLISVEIKKLVLDKKQINMQHQFYIAFPDPTEHQNHLRGESASLLLGIDDRLKEYIRKMVWEENITSVPQMRVLVEVYMKTTLFQGQDIPAIINKRFWPSNVDIQNHIALAVKKQRNKEIDQEVVVDLLKEWKSERPEDNFHLRLKGDHLEPDNDNSDLELNHGDAQETEDDVRIGEAYTRKLYGTNSKFLYVHQTQWQRRLLELYGKEICLLDATYRTTRYSLPLYFLCVPTNVNYITVGTFVTETEDSASLMEGLQVIKEWNPEWSPKFFMCDYATEEINALENVFPGSFVYLCDFHREQSWERWLTAAHNGLHTEKTNVLSLLRPIARALNEDDFNSALSTLKSSSVWNEKEKLRKWFEKTWLSCPRRWVRAHRQERFNVSVNTNNGIERQNLSLKYEYLDKKKARSLSQLLSVLIRKFLPDSYVK
ncbi:uncharacterized protein LOC127720780 [Mytilus californianus]|uniref:uncharacterized protein LOC127720780 n=1 Tax=Mytilus californianus TaxID=6549 RepID=UPI0022456923|nr:uncharacterized protein LOC127720780 [Mytilus californianus]